MRPPRGAFRAERPELDGGVLPCGACQQRCRAERMQVNATFDYCCVAPLGRFKATVWFIHSANVNSDHELGVLDLLVQWGPSSRRTAPTPRRARSSRSLLPRKCGRPGQHELRRAVHAFSSETALERAQARDARHTRDPRQRTSAKLGFTGTPLELELSGDTEDIWLAAPPSNRGAPAQAAC